MSSLSSLSLETSLPKSKLNSSFIQIGILTNFLLRLVVSFIFILRIISFNFSRDINPNDVPIQYSDAYKKNEFFKQKNAEMSDKLKSTFNVKNDLFR